MDMGRMNDKEASAYFRLIAENTDSSISIFRVEGGAEELVYANERFFKMTGLSRKEFEANPHGFASKLVARGDSKRILTAVQMSLKTGEPGVVEHIIKKPDGSVSWINRRYSVIKQDKPDSFLLVSMVNDITDKKNAQIQAELEKGRFETVIKELNAAVFEWNLKTGSFYSSAAYQNYAMSRVSQEDILNNRGPADVVYPDDMAEMNRFFKETAAGSHRTEVILRLKLVNGSFHWCRVIGLYYKDENGNPDRTVGVILDINEERENNFMLSNLLNEIPSGIGIFSFGTRLHCQYFSDGFADMTGRTRQEVDELIKSGTLFETAVAAVDYELFVRTINRAISDGSPIDLTFRCTVKDSMVTWLHLTGIKMREEKGRSVYYCVFTKPTEESGLYRSIVEDSSSGIFVAERATRRVLYMNNRISTLFGIPVDMIEQRVGNSENVSKRFVFLTQEQVDSLSTEAFNEFHVVWENKIHLEIKAKSMRWNGVDAYIAYLKDETGEYEQHARLQKLVDEVPTGIGIYEIDKGRVSLAYMNDAYYEMIGSTRNQREQFVGDNTMAAAYHEDLPNIRVMVKKMLDGADRGSVTYRILAGDGQWKWMRMSCSVIERNGDKLRLYVAFSDCNDMMNAQQELQSTQTRLQAALECAKVMDWKYDYKRHIVTDSGTIGMRYHWPKVMENMEEVLKNLVRENRVGKSSIDDMWWMFEHCGDGVKISRDLQYRGSAKDEFSWLRFTFSPVNNPGGENFEAIGTAVDITDMKERELYYEEQLRLKKMMAKDAVGSAIYNLTQNKITEVETRRETPGVKLSMSASVDEALSALRDDVFSDAERASLECVRDSKTMLRGFASGTNHIELRHHIRGSSRWFLSSFDMIANPTTGDVEAIAVLRDISDQVRAELVVGRLLKTDYESIMTIDAVTGEPHAFKNDSAEGTLHELIEMQEAVSDNVGGVAAFLRKYCSPEEAERVIRETNLDFVKSELEKKPVHECLYSLTRNGRTIHKRTVYTYLDETKSVILCAMQDVSETYEQEEKQKAELSKALKEAETANNAKTAFLSRMSHDLRTPMNGILGLAALSEDERKLSVLHDNIRKIRESGDYLLSLINDTLDFQRIESGKLHLEKEVVSTEAVLESILDIVKPAIEKKNIEFTVQNENAELNWYINIDKLRFKQIVVNLLSNAVKFTPEGGKILFSFACLGREGMISHDCIKVSDNGIGMSEDFIENRLFKPFSQESNAVSAQYVGSGLGLSIVKQLVELMGGRIEVESELGKGSCFTVYIDFERVERTDAKKNSGAEKNKKADSLEKLRGKRILLAEDHPLNAEISARLLAKVGAVTERARDGKQCLKMMMDSAPNYYDAILMDIRMPVMDGLESAKAIRALARDDAKTLPIIAMTANAYKEDIEAAFKAGMNAHIAKPIEPEILYQSLLNCIKTNNLICK